MSTVKVLEELRCRIVGGYPLLWLQTYEELRWTEEIAELASDLERGFVDWSLTRGPQPPLRTDQPVPSTAEFLNQIRDYPEEHLFLLKDLHAELDQSAIVRQLRDLIPALTAEKKTLLMMSPLGDLPVELIKDVTVLELPLPGIDEMRSLLTQLLSETTDITVSPTPREEEHLLQAVLGLTAAEAKKALSQTLLGKEEINQETYAELVREKRRMVQGSNLLEFFDLEEGVDDIGGLEGLKEWIAQRSEAFSVDAQDRGISNPKGVLLAGVQGCGKSLSAKAIAKLLGFPLVRMDLGALLESARGSSEQNLRDVLRLMETIAPSVLWLEEIDKAFAGFSDEANTDATMARLLGRFLTWLQEHREPVFVVATANNVAGLPPEILRRGRFDELFFVDLPNFHERKAIFEIHLKRRGWKPEKFDIEELSNQTEGFSGAEIEQVVNSAIIESYAQQHMLAMQDLQEARERTVPLSVTMEDEIFTLREWARTRCRPATLDNRVMQVMEEEERRGEAPSPERLEIPKWVQLVEHGQIDAAIIEHIRYYDHVTWDRLSHDFGNYTATTGEYGLVLRSDPKIVVWTRLSREMADTLADYIAGKRMYLHLAESDDYAAAQHPALPMIHKLPDERIDRPVWIPTKFRLMPPPGGSGRFAKLARIKLGKSS